jgi:hypothetical protein
MYPLARTALAAFIAYSSHYAITKAYAYYCIPDGIWGFFQGGLTTGSPLCQGAFTVMTQTQTAYSSILITSLSHVFIDMMSYTIEKKHTEPAVQPTE